MEPNSGNDFRRRLPCSIFCAIVILLAGARHGWAQSGASTPRLSLGSASGSPGSALVVPIYFAPEGALIGKLTLETTFVSRNLRFQRFVTGSAVENADIKLDYTTQESKDEKGLEHTTLQVSFQSPTPGSTAVPAGLLGYIQMKVNETAGPAIITFHSKVEASDAGSSGQTREVEIIDDQVEIIAEGSEPLISCFFFTH